MAYKVIILYQLYMPSYFLGTFTEYPFCFSFAYSKNSLNGGTPYCAKNFTLRFRQTPSVVRKTEPDTRSRSNGLPAFYKLQFILPSRTQAYKRSYRPGNSRYSIPEGVPPGHIQIVFG